MSIHRTLAALAVFSLVVGCGQGASPSSPTLGSTSEDLIIHFPLPIFHTPATDLSLGSDGHGCFRVADGTVDCWGSNSSGQLGNGTTTAQPKPVAVPGITTAIHVAASRDGTCAVLANGTVECWGYVYGMGTLSTPTVIAGLSSVIGIAAGETHFCALQSGGGFVYCWGTNQSGEVGVTGTAPGSNSIGVTNVPNLNGIVAITAGNGFTCALSQAGNVTCWGSNNGGQLGGAAAPGNDVPPTKLALANIRQIAASQGNACAVGLNGGVTCWGANTYCSDGVSTNCGFPVGLNAIAGLGYATSVAVSMDHVCAQASDGSVRCWGVSYSLGDGEATLAYHMGNPVTGAASATMIVGGPFATCDLIATDVECWGEPGASPFAVSSTPATIY